MSKKGKNKSKFADDEPKVKITPKLEIIYEYTKAVTEVDPEFKWGQIYHILWDKKVPHAGLEDLKLFDNILRSGITKASTRLELFH